MKVLKTDNFISERMKLRPITNAEWVQVKNDMKNPFGLTEEDLTDKMEDIPMGIAVRMLEEQKKQGKDPDITVFCRDKFACQNHQGFDWDLSEMGWKFWDSVLRNLNFDMFFAKYPSYKKYNI